jgi:hypothetical protein
MHAIAQFNPLETGSWRVCIHAIALAIISTRHFRAFAFARQLPLYVHTGEQPTNIQITSLHKKKFVAKLSFATCTHVSKYCREKNVGWADYGRSGACFAKGRHGGRKPESGSATHPICECVVNASSWQELRCAEKGDVTCFLLTIFFINMPLIALFELRSQCVHCSHRAVFTALFELRSFCSPKNHIP